MPFRIGPRERPAAIDACAAILFMYVDMIRNHRGFGYDVSTGWEEDGRWNPLLYIDCVADERPGLPLGVDLELLHQGSAVALLCHVYDAFAEGGALGATARGAAILAAQEHGRLRHVPLAARALAQAAGSTDERELVAALRPIYDEYVVGQFARLLERSA